jgi:Rod binding domain-containing protein
VFDTDFSRIGTAATALSANTDKLLSQAKSASSDNAKIDKSSKDFESILLSNWLQGAEEAFGKVPGTDEEEDDSDPGAGQFLSMGMQSLGSSLAASGGIGLGKMIAQQLHKTEVPSTGSAAPAPKP